MHCCQKDMDDREDNTLHHVKLYFILEQYYIN